MSVVTDGELNVEEHHDLPTAGEKEKISVLDQRGPSSQYMLEADPIIRTSSYTYTLIVGYNLFQHILVFC